MAHVLLGFHKNVIGEVQKLQKDLEEHESLGRDALNRFAQWRQQSIPERVAYNASSVFGPVGDYRGARDVWERWTRNNIFSHAAGGSCKPHLIGQLSYWHAAEMVDSSLKWCLVNGASIILNWEQTRDISS